MNSAYALLAVIALFLASLYQRQKSKSRQHEESRPEKQLDPYEAIEPLPDFDWQSTPPLRIRPFKPQYHLTMALENMPLSELIAMDNTYLDRIHLRRQIMKDHPTETLACNPCAEPAVLELYTWLLSTYLLKRFPKLYTLSQNSTTLLNTTTNEPIPLTPTSPLSALQTLGAHIDTDFLLLLPRPTQNSIPDQPTYHLEAFSTTFPSGFSTFSKLSLPLAKIHTPVPSYATKLQKSMDRFFARLPAGRAVRRANWTVTTHSKLFAQGGTHLYGGEEEALEKRREAVEVGECRLRCERQTLHRLPETGALVFAFKTYLYTLEEVKGDGDGEALAEAIEGFGKGSVPEMEFYKSAVVWGEKVKEYLRRAE